MTEPTFQDRLKDPSVYLDLVRHFEQVEVYTDYEGFYDETDVNWVRGMVDEVCDPESYDDVHPKETRTILTHYLTESISEAGYRPDTAEMTLVRDVVDWILQCRHWLIDDRKVQ